MFKCFLPHNFAHIFSQLWETRQNIYITSKVLPRQILAKYIDISDGKKITNLLFPSPKYTSK